ncbi:MAG: hypothetical protein HOQ20_10925 [Bradyrhizobium sp.]|nr:hypothetical protein [Bradyrhizobium sp.]
MMLTCHRCPRQIAFPGSKRDFFARLFGWVISGRRYFCPSCGDEGQL